MKILGINAFHADSSACIVIDGIVIVAIEEERLRRVKHWAGYPSESIRSCLEIANLSINDIDFIAINRDPNAHIREKVWFTLKNKPSLQNIISRLKNRKDVGNISSLLADQFSVSKSNVARKLIPVEHHMAHLSSTFFTSPFEDAIALSIDGFGDFISTMWGYCSKNKIEIDDYVGFPHSLGLLYSSLTQFLGFWKYGDEYKVMGMAAYGRPTKVKDIRKLIKKVKGGKFELNTDYFVHHSDGVSMEFPEGNPKLGQVFSDEMINLLGTPRKESDPVDQIHKDIACSLQLVYEEVLFHILAHLNLKYPQVNKLCLSGGCAQNSLANGKITSESNFKEVWVQPAAGDAGGALGAALFISNNKKNCKRFIMNSPALGKKYSNAEIKNLLQKNELAGFDQNYFEEDDSLIEYVVDSVINGKVIGFFHDAFEWGPRALGNRSIIVDPRIDNMKDLLNKKIKKRESFRPFAPSILKEEVTNWFENDEHVPFMTHVIKIKKEKRHLIPAVTHKDGTGRLQTVTKDFNKRYYNIIKSFFKQTKIPMILNTSFNENEPIVNTPQQALDCFLRTKMDIVVLENHVLSRRT